MWFFNIIRGGGTMAIFHLSIKIVSRSSGKGAVAAAAYRAGAKLEEKETGYTHDYTRKSGVVYSEIFLPVNAPQEYQNRILKDNERLRLENEELTDKADAALHKQKQAEQDAAYARSHMKIKEVEVERKVLYEKCKNCKQSLLDKKITNYRKRKEYLENYLFLFMMLCTTTMILTAFQQEAFWKDTVDFFTTFLNGCGEVLEMIADAECGLAQLLADMISQSIWRNVVYWIALALLFIITGILLFFICHMAWDKYRKKVQSGVNMWTVSIAILLLMVVVYLGDYIRMILPMNLLLLWIVGVGVLLVAGIYVAECSKYRY